MEGGRVERPGLDPALFPVPYVPTTLSRRSTLAPGRSELSWALERRTGDCSSLRQGLTLPLSQK